MNRLLLVVLGCLLAACATLDSSEQRPQVAKYGMKQMGYGPSAQLVFCEKGERGDCDLRTQKFLPVPKPTIVKQTSEVPKSVHAKVHFRWGWSQLDAAGHREVRNLLASGKLENARSILVAGRTDPTGARKFNEKLALRRARTVKAALAKAGIPTEKITALAQSPCCDGDPRASPKLMQELRRTDIDITILMTP